MTLCARIFQEIVSDHALAGSLRLEGKDSAQQGVSSVPLHAQIIACSLHSGAEGGPKKQVLESARQLRRIGFASVCT